MRKIDFMNKTFSFPFLTRKQYMYGYQNLFSYSCLLLTALLLCFSPQQGLAQVIIEGYVFESGNRGYIETAAITVVEKESKVLRGETTTDENGKFELAVNPGVDYLVRINKKPFEALEQEVSTIGKTDGDKVFAKFQLERLPGYVFEVTLAPTRSDEDVVVDAITGAWIEVYNNTTGEETLNLKNHPSHTFSCRFEQGNHYTVLIRKDGFFNKRLEAYVNVKGCILCFDGVGEVKPGVSDVLTEGFEMGTLLANVELQPISMNAEVEINNIYYDKGSARLKAKAKEELDQLAILLNDNADLLIEIGSHTDSRGDANFNQKLSLDRAQSVVDYLTEKGINKNQLTARGYGESKLRNSCGNGVECSEARHQKNRRTEFKVIGRVDDQLVNTSSLSAMKEVERMEKLLAELGDSEIKIGEGEPLPEDLKQQLAEQESKKSKGQNGTVKLLLEDGEESIESSEPKQEIQTSPNDSPSSEKVRQVPVSEMQQIKQEQERMSYNNKVTKLEETNKPIEAEDEDFSFDDYEENETVRMVPEQEVNVNSYARAPKKLPKDYRGFKVQIIISTYELPLSHEVFSRHGNIMLEETNQGTYAYLLGDFDTDAEAWDFMDKVISLQYPNARVIEYQVGRRVIN